MTLTKQGVDSNKALDNRLLYQDEEVRCTQEHSFTPEIIEFLDSTTWGTEDTLYEHKKTQERIDALIDPVLIVMRIHGELAGMVVIERRWVYNVSFSCKAYYFRYLATKVNFRNRRIVGVMGRRLIDMLREAEQDKSVYYAFVEASNHRSMNYLKRIGYRPTARMKTIGFSRFFPRRDVRMAKVVKQERPKIIELLKGQFSNFRLVHFNHILQDTDYFVLREGEEIIAGVQPHRASWVIKNIPGKIGPQVLRIMPYIPVLRKLLNPKNFQFLALEGCFYQMGREKDLLKLWESVLHHHGLKSALIWLDSSDPLCQYLGAKARLGLLNVFARQAETQLMTVPENLSVEDATSFNQGPYYTTGFDFV